MSLMAKPKIDVQKSAIAVGDFQVIIDYQCSGLAGIALVSAVMGGYVLSLRRRLWVGRALLLIPLAVALSWFINGFRIALLVRIAGHGSPDLAINGFHSYAGWLAFCVLSALMLFAAENIAWLIATVGPNLWPCRCSMIRSRHRSYRSSCCLRRLLSPAQLSRPDLAGAKAKAMSRELWRKFSALPDKSRAFFGSLLGSWEQSPSSRL